MSELPATERINGDEEIVPVPGREVGLEPRPARFFIASAALVIAMVVAIPLKQMP